MNNVIVVANGKGGCGKSTLSCNLAETLALHGQRVGLLDTDPQGTAYLWGLGEGIKTQVLDSPTGHLARYIASRSASFDYLVVDGTPRATGMETLAAIDSASLLLVPFLPSPADLWSTAAFLEVVLQRRSGLRYLAVPMAATSTSVSTESLERARGLWQVSQTVVHNRTAFRQAMGQRTSVHSLRTRGGVQASSEIKALVIEILAKLHRS